MSFEERFPEERPKIKLSLALTQSEATDLLKELADPESPLSKRIAADPRSILKRLPIEISPARIPETIELPPVELFQAIVERIKNGDFKNPSVPAGYGLLMMVLPLACPGSDDDEDDGCSDDGDPDDDDPPDAL